MSRDVIAVCPVCESRLSVTRLRCGECGTTIEGDFSVGRFGRLNRDQMALLESFLRARGNLKDMERELGISYPTVRAKVDALVRALGLAGDHADDGDAPVPGGREPRDRGASVTAADDRRAVLERLARREITAEEAAATLRRTRGGD